MSVMSVQLRNFMPRDAAITIINEDYIDVATRRHSSIPAGAARPADELVDRTSWKVWEWKTICQLTQPHLSAFSRESRNPTCEGKIGIFIFAIHRAFDGPSDTRCMI
jgi:hypothetical protein